MSDATPIAREWLHERSLSLERTDDLAAMLEAYEAERTAALRAALEEAMGLLGRYNGQDTSPRYKRLMAVLDAPEAARASDLAMRFHDQQCPHVHRLDECGFAVRYERMADTARRYAAEQTKALRAALNALLQPDVTRCASERCGECAACHARAVLAAPEAAP